MTPAAYLESLGHEVHETRGNLFEVALPEGSFEAVMTETELAAFAEEVRTQREQNPWPNR